MTFAQRIELGQIITDTTVSEYQKFRAAMVCIDPRWTMASLKQSVAYWQEVLEGIAFWVNREKTELNYKPNPEELAAGIDVLSKRVKEMGTIMALAKDYGRDPDEILGWKYGKVFNILFSNLETFKYNQALEKRYAEKAKREQKRSNLGRK